MLKLFITLIICLLININITKADKESRKDCKVNGNHRYCLAPNNSCCGSCSNVYCCRPGDRNQLDTDKCDSNNKDDYDDYDGDDYWNAIAIVYIIIGIVFILKAIVLIIWLMKRRQRLLRATVVQRQISNIRMINSARLNQGFVKNRDNCTKIPGAPPSYLEATNSQPIDNSYQAPPPAYASQVPTISTIA